MAVDRDPATDEEWRDLALVLLIGLCLRLGWHTVEPLTGVLLIGAMEPGPAPWDAVRAWWDSRCPESLRDLPALHWQERLDWVTFHFADCGLWRGDETAYELTDLGRDFAIAFTNALDSGLLERD